MEGEEHPVAEGTSAAAQHGRSGHAQPKQEEEREQHEGQASAGKLTKWRRHDPMQPEASPSAAPREEHTQEGPLTLLPGDVLDHVMLLLAAEEGGSCIRSTCSWLRSTFDRCNNRLVLRGTCWQLPYSFSARLLDLVRYSPCVSSLTLAEDMECVTWPELLEAGGPQLLQRLERLTLMHCPRVLDLEALAACTRLQRLFLGFLKPGQKTALQLQPLAACGSTLRHLEIHDCRPVRDFTPLAACAALQHLALAGAERLTDLTPLAACVRLQQLRLSAFRQLQDLSPLTACVQLQTLHITGCLALTELGPLTACAALRELRLSACFRVCNLVPLASCAGLQHLALRECMLLEDLVPLAACVALRTLDLTSCRRVKDLGPLAACVGLQALILYECGNVQSLSPLASCLGLESLDLGMCWAPDRSSLAALPHLRIIE